MSKELITALFSKVQKSMDLSDQQFAAYIKEQRRALDRDYSKQEAMLWG